MCAIWWPRTLVVHCLEKDVRTQEAFVARNKTGENLLCKTWHGKPILVIWHSVSTGSVLVGSREILTTTLIEVKNKAKESWTGGETQIIASVWTAPLQMAKVPQTCRFSHNNLSLKKLSCIWVFFIQRHAAALLRSVTFRKECKLYNLHCPQRFRAKPQVTNSTMFSSFDFWSLWPVRLLIVDWP